MFIAPAIVISLAFLGGLAYEAYAVVRRRKAAALEALRSDPENFLRAQLNQEAPRQLDLSREVDAAEDALTESDQKVTSIGKDLPSDPPPGKWRVVVLAFMGLWLVAFTVQFLLDFRIAAAVTGSAASAALTALVASGLLSATTLAAAFLWEKRTAVHPSLLRLGLVASAALFCSVLLVVVALAPKRADLDFAGRIDTAKQSIAMLKEDGDTLALSLEETHLSRLEEQRSQAATFYQAVAVAAGVLEGGTSLAVPSGYILMSYLGAQGLVRRRTAEVTKARNRVARSRERFAARMSRLLERAGVTQDQLGPLLRGAGGQSPQAPPRPNPPPDSLPPAPPPVPPSPDHEPTVPPQGDGPQDGPRDQGPGTGPDPSFDQS